MCDFCNYEDEGNIIPHIECGKNVLEDTEQKPNQAVQAAYTVYCNNVLNVLISKDFEFSRLF